MPAIILTLKTTRVLERKKKVKSLSCANFTWCDIFYEKKNRNERNRALHLTSLPHAKRRSLHKRC